jgi:hypothetical protein
MGTVKLSDLRSVRRALGKSQSGIADLLGNSIRAVQSYEQGWREIPPAVQKLAGLLLAWSWRRNGNKAQPCWKICDCSAEMRANCQAYQFRAGDYCWAVTGDYHKTRKLDSWDAKLAKCQKCPVMRGCLTL